MNEGGEGEPGLPFFGFEMTVHVAVRVAFKRFRAAVQTGGGFIQHNVTVLHGHMVRAKMMVLNVKIPGFVRHIVQVNYGA